LQECNKVFQLLLVYNISVFVLFKTKEEEEEEIQRLKMQSVLLCFVCVFVFVFCFLFLRKSYSIIKILDATSLTTQSIPVTKFSPVIALHENIFQ
jgi:hypothetical protein